MRDLQVLAKTIQISPTPAPAMAAIHAPFAVVILLSVF